VDNVTVASKKHNPAFAAQYLKTSGTLGRQLLTGLADPKSDRC
jgi:hypothetical protein